MTGKKQKFYETNSFKKLQARWYEKLREDGFVDIEKTEDEYLVRPEVFISQPAEYMGGTEYRKLCEEILEKSKFRTEIHRAVFKLHTEGVSERKIQKEIEIIFGETLSQPVIHRFITKTLENYKKGKA